VPGRAFLREKKLIGSFYGSNSLQRDIPKLVDLYMDGKIMVDELISKRRPLNEINEAFDDMLAGEVARSVLHPSGI
jgi:S-(hydroxymethyl)glutathione dehydrogenase/alcohol dehydrogenase